MRIVVLLMLAAGCNGASSSRVDAPIDVVSPVPKEQVAKPVETKPAPEPSPKKIEPPTPPIEIRYVQLWRTYREEIARAELTYTGKRIVSPGAVDSTRVHRETHR